jgi:alanine transaminase
VTNRIFCYTYILLLPSQNFERRLKLKTSSNQTNKMIQFTTAKLLLVLISLSSSSNVYVHGSTASTPSPAVTSSTQGEETTTATTAFIPKKRLTEQSMTQNLRTMEYAVRGQVVIAADRINSALTSSTTSTEEKYPFDHIVYTNIGNPHGVGQSPLTWPRQVLALTDLPDEQGVNNKFVTKMFPKDAIQRAKDIKKALGGHGTGAYTHSQGPIAFRKDICSFIEERDGLEEGSADPDTIFMTNGASSGIEMILNALIADESCGVMIPIPQYPIYSATIDQYGGKKVGYYLDEEDGWGMNMEELERSLKEAQEQGINVNSFVLINPGNPTGQVLSKKAIQEIVKFCSKHKLVLLSDEVYQDNVYDDNAEFYSCKRAAVDTGLIKDDAIELISFHSTSKGLFGECGRRGGYMELVGIDPDVKDQLYKLSSASLCSNVPGQIMTSLMVNGPKPGDVSYKSHEAEKKAIFESLKRRAKIATDGLNDIPGFSCQQAQGSMYIFPKVNLPQGAIDLAAEKGTTADTLYAVSLLESTGICVVPASGFGQEEGRFGFRTTFLPSEDEMVRVVGAMRKHHVEFCSRFE